MWIVLLTVMSIALIAVAISVDVWRIMASGGDDAPDGAGALTPMG